MIVFHLFPIGAPFFFDIEGNIPISGLFDVHDYDEGSENCGKIKTQTGVMYLEAMLFALDKINNNSTFLYGNKLAARLFDSCSSQKLLKRNLDNAVNHYKTQGIVGPQYSEDALLAAAFLEFFERSLISYSAASPDLDDHSKYPNFFRTLPSYHGQIRAMIDLALHFKWTYVSFVYSSTIYQKASSYFVKMASTVGICVPAFYSVDKKQGIDNFVHVLRLILKKSKVKVLFIFLVEHDLHQLLLAAKKIKDEIKNITFVGSDSWGGKQSVIQDLKDITRGSLTIQPHTRNVGEFETYFLSLNPRNNKRNPWFSEFWEHTFNCSLKRTTDNRNVCSEQEKIKFGLGYYENTPVLSVINAVYAYAYVFRRILKTRCISRNIRGTDCVLYSQFFQGSSNLRDIRDMLQNIRFGETFGEGIFFSKNSAQMFKQYDILNVKVKEHSNEYYYDLVGTWKDTNDISTNASRQYRSKILPRLLFLESREIVWKNTNKMPPKSTCSDKCEPGLYRLYEGSSKCCWKCLLCGFNEYILNNTCIPCRLDYVPDTSLQKCIALKVTYLDLESPVSASITVLSAVGLALSVAVVAMFLKKFQHPVIKASGRELCLSMLIGIMITYIAPIIFLLEPSLAVCLVQKVIISTGFTFSFAPLALKLNRIYRIFQCSKRMQLRPPAVSPKSQVALLSVISLVGILLPTVSVKDDPPRIDYNYPAHRKYVIKYCTLQPSTLPINLSYSSILMIISTWYAFKTRHFPENFNETRYIGFTMYTTCLVLCGSLPPFFIINNNGNGRILIMCFVCEAIATINLIGLFVPKLVKVLQQSKPSSQTAIGSESWSTSQTFQLSMGGSITQQELSFSSYTGSKL